MVLAREALEKCVTQAAAGVFQIPLVTQSGGTNVLAIENEFESQRPGQVGNELRVFLRGRAAKAVIEMQNGQRDAQSSAQAVQETQQSNRVGAAGNRDAH